MTPTVLSKKYKTLKELHKLAEDLGLNIPSKSRKKEVEKIILKTFKTAQQFGSNISIEKPLLDTDNDEIKYSKEWVALFIHQNTLMWSRLKTIGVIQLASLTSSYSMSSKNEIFSFAILLVGFFLTLLVFNLHMRDTGYREEINKKIKSIFQLNLGRRWFAPLKGTEIVFLLYTIIFGIDLFIIIRGFL